MKNQKKKEIKFRKKFGTAYAEDTIEATSLTGEKKADKFVLNSLGKNDAKMERKQINIRRWIDRQIDGQINRQILEKQMKDKKRIKKRNRQKPN